MQIFSRQFLSVLIKSFDYPVSGSMRQIDTSKYKNTKKKTNKLIQNDFARPPNFILSK